MNTHSFLQILLDSEAATRIGTGAIVGILTIIVLGVINSIQSDSALGKLKKEYQSSNPNIDMLHDLAAYYLNNKKHEEAIPVIKRALEFQPSYIDLLFMIANTYCFYDKDNEAEPYLSKLSDIIIEMENKGLRAEIEKILTPKECGFVTYRYGMILFEKGDILKSN